jgi:hypothetical protein
MLGRNGLTAKVEICPAAEKGLQSRQKNNNCNIMKKIAMIIVLIMAVISSGQAQEKLKVGELKNGKLLVTDANALKAYFMNSLEKSGTLSKEYKVSYAPEGDRLFLYHHVTGNMDHVTNIGIMLIIYKHDVFLEEGRPEIPGGLSAGGSFEVQCFGSCPTCMPNIKWVSGNWLPIVFCQCTGGESGNCSMITKLVVSLELGF